MAAPSPRPTTDGPRRWAPGRRRRRWASAAGALGVLAVVGAVAVGWDRDGDSESEGVDERGVLVASSEEMDILDGDRSESAPDDASSSGDIAHLLGGVDAIVEIDRIELVGQFPTQGRELRNLVFAVDVGPVDGAPPPDIEGSTRIYEPNWEGEASLVSLIEPGTRVIALLGEADPTLGDAPGGATHSLAALLSIADEGEATFLAVEPRHLNTALAEARAESSFEGTDIELLAAWIDELTDDADGDPITAAYRAAQAPPAEPTWHELPPDERSVEPGSTPEEVLATLRSFQVLVEAEPAAAAVDADEHVVWLTSELGVHHTATLHNSIGGVWLGPDSQLTAEIRTSNGTAVVPDVDMPPVPDVADGEQPTLLVTVDAGGDRFRINGEWIDASAAQSVLERWSDDTASAPSPEPR